jgi:hypothetical protein
MELMRLAYKSRERRVVLNVRSLKSLPPALSSMEFSFKFRDSRVVFSFKAWER